MPSQIHKRIMLIAALPTLIATAAFAQETPSAPAPSSPPSNSQPVSPEQKAYDDAIARMQRARTLAETQKATFEAQKAAHDAEAAATTSALGPLAAYQGAHGTVGLTDPDHSILEATMLSSVALREAAQRIANNLCGSTASPDICPSLAGLASTPGVTTSEAESHGPQAARGRNRETPVAAGTTTLGGTPVTGAQADLCSEFSSQSQPATISPRPIVIVSEDSRGLVYEAETFEIRSAALGRQFCTAMESAAATSIQHPPPREPAPGATGHNAGAVPEKAGGTAAIAAAATAVNTIANLLRSDYTVYGITVERDQNLLVRQLAGVLIARRVPYPIYTPGLFPVTPTSENNPALHRFDILSRLRGYAAAEIVKQALEASAFERQLANAGDNTNTIQAGKAAHDEAKARLVAAISAYDEMMTALTTAQGTEPPPASAIIRQAYTAQLLRQGALLIVTNVHFTGGTSYTRQNFFTSLLGMPYHVSGGALASYIAQDGRTGQVYGAMTVPVASTYVRPTDLRRVLESSMSER